MPMHYCSACQYPEKCKLFGKCQHPDAGVRAEKQTAASSRQMSLQRIVKALLDAGWKENGFQQVRSYRTATQAYGGGSLVKTGGRQRWTGPVNRRCTLGPNTVCLFEIVKGTPSKFRNYSVRYEMDKAIADITATQDNKNNEQ